MLLDQYEPRIRRLIEDVIAGRPDAGGWLAAPYSLIGYRTPASGARSDYGLKGIAAGMRGCGQRTAK